MKKRICFITFTCMAALMFLCIEAVEPSSAAADPVRIYDFEADEGRMNASVVYGTTTNAVIGYKLNGITEKSHTWSVDDGTICRINIGSNGKISLTGLKEGLTRVRLSVKATDGKTYKDYTLVSVYTSLQTAKGTITQKTLASRSAHSGTENDNERAYIPKGTAVSIYGKCGNYYRATVTYNFTDGLETTSAYILAKDINVPVTGITLDKASAELKKGERLRLNASVIPIVATDKTMSWKSSDPEVVSVNQNGILSGKKDGEAVIEAWTGGKTASCKVNVSGEYKHEALKLNTSTEALAIGDKTKLYAPSGVVDTFTSSNNTIVTVGRDGTVEGIAPGEAQITAVSLYDEKVICKVTVKYPNAPKATYKKAKDGKYSLSWSKVGGVTGYQVYKYKSKKAGYKKYKTLNASAKRKLTVPKGTYQVRSYKKNKGGKTYYSAFTVAKLKKTTTAKYKIIYKGNGAVGKSYSQTVDFNKKTRIKANKFKRAGYAFVGWSTSKKGKVILKNKASVKKLTNKKQIKLYAIWRSDNDPNGKVQRQALLYADTKDKDIGASTKRDINQMKKVLDSARFPGEKQINVVKHPNKTKTQIKNKIQLMGKKTTSNDVTYLVFSCHGGTDGTLYLGNGKSSDVSPSELREWLDNYVDGKVVMFMDFCYSGRHMKKLIAGSESAFIKEFVSAGEGKDVLKKNKKYKILTASDDGESLGGWLGVGIEYWSLGMGFDYDGTKTDVFADLQETDHYGNKCYGNKDGKVTLTELHKFSRIPIHSVYVNYNKGLPNKERIKVTYPQIYPQDDAFVIYQR